MRIKKIITASIVSFLFSNSCILAVQALPDLNSQKAFKIYEIAQAQRKLRVAVLNFDYSSLTDPNWVLFFYRVYGGASGVSDILINKLVETGHYSVIERSRLDAVLNEQNLGTSGRLDPSSAAQVGKLLGVDLVIIGSITQFDLQHQQSGGSFIYFSVGSSSTDAYVQLNVRLVNTTTGEIIAVAEGKGNKSQSDSSVNVLGIGGGSATSNEGKLLTLATQQAVDQIVQSIDSKALPIANSPQYLPSSLVAAVTGNQIILNKGKTEGYKVGMTLDIERVTQVVKDPQTGKVLRQMTQKIGTIKLVDSDDGSSVGAVLRGSQFKVGDIAKPVQ